MEGAGALGNPEVIGMMYWTSTGIFETIKKRNEKMWDPPNIARLRKLWAQGLEDFVAHSAEFAAGRFVARKLILMQSELTPQGAVYTVLARFPLRAHQGAGASCPIIKP